MRLGIGRVAMAIAFVACGKGGDKAPSGNSARDDVIAMWKKGGLDPSALTPATTSVGKDCAAGTVNKVDVLVCTFGSADEAKHAVDAGLQWVGDTTGWAHVKGSLIIAVADRHKADPSGRTLNQIDKLVPK